MAKGNVKFTARVRAAIESLADDSSLGLVSIRSGSLYSPVFRNGEYEWAKVMDSDGLLVGPRKVKSGEGADPKGEVEPLVGVVVQSEDSTSQTKPNPLGKAAIGHVEGGIWVDVRNEGRKRLDRVYVLMLVPRGSTPSRQKRFTTAKRNVENAAVLMPNCEILVVSRGIGAAMLTNDIMKRVRPLFKGRGRPKASGGIQPT